METVAPPVVAVIVCCDPGEWFEDTLRAFASQEYPELSVLVLDAASRVDPTPRVAAVLPGAFVRHLDTNLGFGASLNQVLGMVEGAPYLLLCHDDVAPDPDAVHIMVEESFRSNAAIVAPKLVDWHDPSRLLHVGMAVDKGGAVVDRVQRGEIDHGQHDAVRDVFLAPGGCTLVRTDLFSELGGFDPEVFALGEDLDLCWRAQILGARVVVAPGARVRHLEMLASGVRCLPDHVRDALPQHDGATAPSELDCVGASGALSAHGAGHDGVEVAGRTDGGPPGNAAKQTDAAGAALDARRTDSGSAAAATRADLHSLQRRHELHAALKGYSRFHLARVLPQLVVLAAAEAALALLAGHPERARAVVHAWRWNLARRRALYLARSELSTCRRLSDAEVRRLQLHGSARLNAYVRRAVTQGLDAANRGELPNDDLRPARVTRRADREVPPEERGDGPAASTRRVVWLVVALVLVFGTRQLLGSGFPFVGQLLPMPSWGTLLHRFATGWQPTGVGTTDPTSPATGVLGLSGMVLFGGVGLLQKIVVLGCIPIGAFGMARLTRPIGTAWARVTSTVIYLAIPVPYDALATGRWDALVMYAASPWMLALLGRASGVKPFGAVAPEGSRRWTETLPGLGLKLGVIEALAVSIAPTAATVTLVLAGGLAAGCVIVSGRGGFLQARRVAATAGVATVVTVVLLAPWSASLLGGPGRWQTVFGLPVSASQGAGWGALLRLAVGPIGDAALAWAFLAAAALPLVIGARSRLAWAGRAWTIALVAWAVAWAAGRGWLGPVAIPPQMLLAPAGVGIALAVGLGVSAFQLDLPSYRFGWRQAAAVLAASAATVGMLPVLAASLGGHWDLPSSGYGQATSWMVDQRVNGDFRVLWLGDPRVLPGSGWRLQRGLAYALSEDGLPDATALWPGSSPGPASAVGTGIELAERHATVRLGQLLAPYAVRYVVVAETLAPTISGNSNPVSYPPPADLLPALASQLDLRHVISQGGFDVFVDDSVLPVRAVRTRTAAPVASSLAVTGGAADLAGWRPVLPGSPGASSVQGRVPAGTVLVAVAPADKWRLTGPAQRDTRARPAFGYAASFAVRRPEAVTVAFAGSWQHGVALAAEVGAWIVVGCALAGRRRWRDWWWTPIRRHAARRRAGSMADIGAVRDVEDLEGSADSIGDGNGRVVHRSTLPTRRATPRRPVPSRSGPTSSAARTLPRRHRAPVRSEPLPGPGVPGDGDNT